MNKALRLIDLTAALQGRRAKTVRELAERLDVSERTVFRYLADLEELHHPIERTEHGYRLLETHTLKPLNLTAHELSILRLALTNPGLTANPDLAHTITALTTKLEAATQTEWPADSPLHLTGPVHDGEGAPLAFEALHRAATTNTTVEMEYDSLSGRARTRRHLDPYQLFQRKGAWYVAGHCHTRQELRIFRLDRCADIEETGDGFERPEGNDVAERLEAAWSVMVGDEVHDVELVFDEALRPLVMNARLHPHGEVEALEDGRVRYRVRLSGLEEVARWIVGFGGAVTVLSPSALQEHVLSLAQQILDQRLEPVL